MRDQVRAYYDRFGEQEWLRLTRPDDGALEFHLTCHLLGTYLPPQAHVLDIGAGPGRYSIWLAQQGHRVVLADLSPELLRIAREKVADTDVANQVEEIVEADACDLSRWGDASFDAVLSLGPFYHLPDPGDHDRAARELVRVLRPGGHAFVALMPRYAFLRRTLAIFDERRHLADPTFVARVLEQGVFLNDVPGRFTGGYGVRPQDVAPSFEQYGLKTCTLVATESMVPDLQGALADLASADPAAYQAALDVLIHVAGDPSIQGMASHLLYVAYKIEGDQCPV
ncbi:MAG TPA: methyltransferase domain-containing protein [Chloroflexota bacterium]|jgi:SAM-dependent methyltransferase|nr:methyltransferase domain-containing protein [Chloroflexota bacterium]